MKDLELSELLRYSRYVSLHQSEPHPDRLATQLTPAEQNASHGLLEAFKAPDHSDVMNAVAEVVCEFAPHRATPAMSRGKTMNNTLYGTFNSYGTLESMPAAEQDLFMGLCRSPLTESDNTRFSAHMIFMILKSKISLNPEDLSNWLNIKRRLRGWKDIDVKHARQLIQKARHIMAVWDLYGFVKNNLSIEQIESELDPYVIEVF